MTAAHKTARYAHNDGGKCFMVDHNAGKLGLYTTSDMVVVRSLCDGGGSGSGTIAVVATRQPLIQQQETKCRRWAD